MLVDDSLVFSGKQEHIFRKFVKQKGKYYHKNDETSTIQTEISTFLNT